MEITKKNIESRAANYTEIYTLAYLYIFIYSSYLLHYFTITQRCTLASKCFYDCAEEFITNQGLLKTLRINIEEPIFMRMIIVVQ